MRLSCAQCSLKDLSIPAPMFYSKPQIGVHVTEMMTYDWSMSMIIVHVFMCCKVVLRDVICLFT